MIAKVQGNIVDVLMPPLSPLELALGWVGGGGHPRPAGRDDDADRDQPVSSLSASTTRSSIVYHAIAASMLLSLIGVIGGIWAEKFDHIAAITNFRGDAAGIPVRHLLHHRPAAGRLAVRGASEPVLLYDPTGSAMASSGTATAKR